MDSFKNLMKIFAKNLLKSKILMIGLPSILMITIISAVATYIGDLGAAKYKDGSMSNTPYAASTYVKSIKFTENGIIFLYKYTDEATGEEKEEEKKSAEMAQILWDEMIKEGSKVKKYISSVEELEKLMNAEIITQYPKLNKNVDLNGTVEFERHKTDGSISKLEYINLDKFNKKIEEKNTDVVNFFTLDENGNLLIGIVDETTETLTSNDSEMVLGDYTSTLSSGDLKSEGNYSKTEYNVFSKAVNYKSVVSKYTMPFQYLWSLIVIGDDKGIGLELADLVENSEIIVSIYDNITTTVNTTTNTYNREKKVDVSATATAETSYGDKYTQKDSWKTADEWEEDDNYQIKQVVTYKENTPIIDVTKANVWIVDYSKDYTYQASKQTSEENNSKNLDDTDYIDDGENPVSSKDGDGSDLLYYDKFKGKLQDLEKEAKKYAEDNTDVEYVNGVAVPFKVSTSITSCDASYYKHNVNRVQTDNTTVSVQKYVAGNVKNEPKIKKKTEEELNNGTGQNNFVTILCDKNHIEARKKITTEVPSWLFELLEANPDTINMVDLTKYLINQVLGKEKYKNIDINFDSLYGVNSEAFNMNSMSSGDINVSDESLFITDLEKLKQAFTGYSNSGKLVENAQAFLDMQSKYKVNALFAAAVSITETGAGNAGNAIKTATGSNSVGASIGQCWNNWFNIKTSSTPYGLVYNGEGESHYKIYTNVSSSIDNFGYNIAEGSYYYKQNKYTVNDIGHTYCPNSAAYPTQGDDWVEHTLTYMSNFYSAAGIAMSVGEGNAPKEGSSDEKLNYLFPNGIPTTQAECSSYITTVSVALTKKDGTKTTGNISVHKSLASDVQDVFQKVQNAGFKIYEASGYSYRQMNNGGSGKLSHHSYGVAIDINVNENYSHRGSVIYAGSFWNPSQSEFSIPTNGALVSAFEAKGWKWGGKWSGNYQDYMHFSYTGK